MTRRSPDKLHLGKSSGFRHWRRGRHRCPERSHPAEGEVRGGWAGSGRSTSLQLWRFFSPARRSRAGHASSVPSEVNSPVPAQGHRLQPRGSPTGSPPARPPERGSGGSAAPQSSRGGQAALPRALPRAPRWPRGLPGPHQLGPPPASGEPARSRYLDVRRVLAQHRGHGSAYSPESPRDRPSVRPQASVRDPSDSGQKREWKQQAQGELRGGGAGGR